MSIPWLSLRTVCCFIIENGISPGAELFNGNYVINPQNNKIWHLNLQTRIFSRKH